MIANRQSLATGQQEDAVQLVARRPWPQISGIVPDEHAYQQQQQQQRQQQQQQHQQQHPHFPQPHRQQQGARAAQHWKHQEAMGTVETTI